MSEAVVNKPDARQLTDFPDGLSPMLVKELRQGMRTHLFTIAFILLQAFMVLCVLIGASTPGESAGVSGFFWFFVIVALLVVMPIRGFGALNSEVQINTMDLIHLTELSAWRITFGKWAALVSQTLLLVCGILPYLVMRYFFGGVDLVHEIVLLFWTLVASMVLTSITVGFSAFRSALLRSAVAVGVGIGAIALFSTGVGFVAFRPMGGSVTMSAAVWAGFGVALFLSLFLIYFMLDMGASRIAPDAENHATRKRLIGLGVAGVVVALVGFGVDGELCAILAASVLGLVCVDAVTERPSMVPSVLRPFARRFPGNFLAKFLAPGWHTGILFFFLCAVLIFVIADFVEGGRLAMGPDLELPQIIVSLAGMLVFPLLIIQLFMPRVTHEQSYFGFYVLIQGCVAVLSLFLLAVAESTPVGEVAYLICPIPMVTLLAAMNSDDAGGLLVFAVVFLAASVAVTLWRAAPLFESGNRIMKALRAEEKGGTGE